MEEPAAAAAPATLKDLDPETYARMRSHEHRLGASQFGRFLRLAHNCVTQQEYMEELRLLIAPGRPFTGNRYTRLGSAVEEYLMYELKKKHEDLKLNQFHEISVIPLAHDLFGDGNLAISFGITPDVFSPAKRQLIEIKTKCEEEFKKGCPTPQSYRGNFRFSTNDHCIQTALYSILLSDKECVLPQLVYFTPRIFIDTDNKRLEAWVVHRATFYGRATTAADRQLLFLHLEKIFAFISAYRPEDGSKYLPRALVNASGDARQLLRSIIPDTQDKIAGLEYRNAFSLMNRCLDGFQDYPTITRIGDEPFNWLHMLDYYGRDSLPALVDVVIEWLTTRGRDRRDRIPMEWDLIIANSE